MGFVYYLDKLPLPESGYFVYATPRQLGPRLKTLIPQLIQLDRHQAYVLGYLLPSKGLVSRGAAGSGFLGFQPGLPLSAVLRETVNHTHDMLLDLGAVDLRRHSRIA